jgi:hypothetical protein
MSAGGFKNLITDGLIYEIDAINNLCGNISNAKNIFNPTEISTFVNGVTVVSDIYDIDGIDDYINVPLTISSQLRASTVGGTITFRTTHPAAQSRFMAINRQPGNTESILEFRYLGTTALRIYWQVAGLGVRWWMDMPNVFNVGGSTTEITLVHDRTRPYVYADGVLQTNNYSNQSDITSWFTDDIADMNRFRIGGMNYNNLTFSGKMELPYYRVWDRPLSSDEVIHNFNAQKYRFI